MYKWKEEIPKEKILINILPEKLHLTFPLIDANLHEFLCFLKQRKKPKIDIRNKFIEKDYGTFAWVF